jgi:hypothetical protein
MNILFVEYLNYFLVDIPENLPPLYQKNQKRKQRIPLTIDYLLRSCRLLMRGLPNIRRCIAYVQRRKTVCFEEPRLQSVKFWKNHLLPQKHSAASSAQRARHAGSGTLAARTDKVIVMTATVRLRIPDITRILVGFRIRDFVGDLCWERFMLRERLVSIYTVENARRVS